MIKRQFYRIEHADRDDAADSSSSSSSDSESELEGQATEGSEDEAIEHVKESGYESENSSADEMNVSSPGVINEDDAEIINEDDAEIGNERQLFVDDKLHGKRGANETKSKTTEEKASVPIDFPDCVLQIKSVFRCRICPRTLCLSKETIKAHFNSKRHARSEKLLKENRLKAMLNDDGEIENQETAAEMNARIIALAQDNPKTKTKRRQRKRNLPKERVNEDLIKKKAKQFTRGPAKKRHKSEN